MKTHKLMKKKNVLKIVRLKYKNFPLKKNPSVIHRYSKLYQRVIIVKVQKYNNSKNPSNKFSLEVTFSNFMLLLKKQIQLLYTQCQQPN